MAVDYADKGNPRKRKPQKKQQAKRRPVVLTLLAVLILAGFVLFLWSLKQNGAADTPVTEQQSPEVEPVVEEEPLPSAPEERWQYIRELENRQVEVVVPERGESQQRLMQCGSFRRESEADSLRAQIAMMGFESQVRRSENDQGNIWYRVILGPFDGLRDAQGVNNQLRRGNIHGCQIWLWNLD